MTEPNWYRVLDANGQPDIEAQERLTTAWPDAPTSDLYELESMLSTARQQVVDYAPARATDPETGADLGYTPDECTRYELAQLRQTTNLHNAGEVNGAGDIGVDQYTFTPRPLDKTIRQIIRPVSSYADLY